MRIASVSDAPPGQQSQPRTTQDTFKELCLSTLAWENLGVALEAGGSVQGEGSLLPSRSRSEKDKG